MQRRRVSRKARPKGGRAGRGGLQGRPDLPTQQYDPPQLDQGDSGTPAPADVTISFIVPTIGRTTLYNLLRQLTTEIGPDDEVLVVGDGEQKAARDIMLGADKRFTYFEHAGGWGSGNGQRDEAIKRAKGTFLMFVDDDDLYWPGAINTIVRPALTAAPAVPHMFRLVGGPIGDQISMGRIMGPMFVPPNDKARLGKWHRESGNPATLPHNVRDYFFVTETLAFYEGQYVLHPETIYLVRPHADFYMNSGVPKSLLAQLA